MIRETLWAGLRFLLEAAAFFSTVLIVAVAVIVFALAVYPPTNGMVREIVQAINTGDWE